MSKIFLFQAIQFSQTVLIQTIQFSISMQFSSIWPIDRALSYATIPGQSGSVSDNNEVELCTPQSSSITGTSPSDCLMSYPGHSFGVGWCFYPSAEVLSMYSTAPANWETHRVKCKNNFISDNSVEHKYAGSMSKQFYFKQFS